MTECPSDEMLAGLAHGVAVGAESSALLDHVDDCARCRDWIDKAHDDRSFVDELRFGDPRPPAPGDWIGSYCILKHLANGGMGEVYLVEQRKPVRRNVALKLIKLGMDTREVIARFESERQALAMMNHPNIAAIHDGGISHRGRPFFVMEYVDGVRITDYCDQKRFTVPQRLDLFMVVCDAVQHAHQKGIIHRDLKPSNVLVTEANGKPLPKVIDFGVAKAVGPEMPERTRTSQGHIVGTLDYMSPEQAGIVVTPEYMSSEQVEKGAIDVDTRSDIYSLGVMLYELLTGIRPLEFEKARQSGDAAVRRIFGECDPKPPSSRFGFDAKRLARQIKGDLDWITLKCLEKNRSRRYPTANALALDIQRHLTREPVLAGPPSTIYRLGRFVSRHRASAVASFAVAISLVFGVVGTTMGLVRARSEATKAIREARKADTVGNFLQNVFASVTPADRPMRDVRAVELLESAVKQIPETGDPEAEVWIRLSVGTAYRKLGLWSDAEPHFRKALQVCRQSTACTGSTKADTLDALATWCQEDDRLQEAEELFREALEIRRKITEADVGASINNLALLLLYKGELAGAELLYTEALQWAQEHFGREHPNVARVLNSLGGLRRHQQRPKEAEQYCKEALAIFEKQFGDSHMEVAETLDNLANCALDQGRLREADGYWVKAIEIVRNVAGNNHPTLAVLLSNSGAIALEFRQFEHADRLFMESYAILQKELRDDHEKILTAKNNIARVRVKQNRFEEAENLDRQILEVRREKLGEHELVADSLNNLAMDLFYKCDYPSAIPMLYEALGMYHRLLGEKNAKSGSMLSNLTAVLQKQKDLDASEAAGREAVRRLEHSSQGDQPVLAYAWNNLGEVLREKGDFTGAINAHRSALEMRRRLYGDNHHLTEESRLNLKACESAPLNENRPAD